MSGAGAPSLRVLRIAGAILVLAALGVTFVAIQSRQGEEGRRLGSLRNLQQWGIALNLYLIENGNELPEVGRVPVTSDQARAWFNALPPYLSEPPLASLRPSGRPRPGVPSLWIRPDSRPVKIWDPDVFFFNYGMNAALQPEEGKRSFRISELRFPAQVVFLVPTSDFSPAASVETTVFSGAGDAHILFCDGHAEVVPRSRLEDPAALGAASAESGLSWFRN